MVTNGYNYHRDEPRLTKQRDRIFNLMKDGMKRSLSETLERKSLVVIQLKKSM